jgi:hypothetical protein
MTSKTNDALTNGMKVMQKQVKILGGVDKVDDLMDGLKEVHTDAQEIDNAMNREVGGIPTSGPDKPSARERGTV